MGDDFTTFRDHFLSLYQSVVLDVATQLDQKSAKAVGTVRRRAPRLSAAGTLPRVAARVAAVEYARQRGLTPPNDPATRRRTSVPEIGRVCAELTLRYMKAKVSGDDAATAQILDEYKARTYDPAEEHGRRISQIFLGSTDRGGEIPYIRAAQVGPGVIKVKADARIALVGDWGTGAPPAIQVLKQIGEKQPDILVHLGDIYCSGTPAECRQNILEPISSVLRAGGQNLKPFTLSGNHDMYCGGAGFYEIIKEVNQAPYTQPGSFFCLRSEDEKWQLLAMDTGLTITVR